MKSFLKEYLSYKVVKNINVLIAKNNNQNKQFN